MGKKAILVLIVILIIVAGFYFWAKSTMTENSPRPIGGDKDAGGCLVAAGYAFDESVGACIRNFEMTPDIMRAAKIAVDYAGRSYGLTVVSFNSYEEPGAYDIFIQSGSNGAQRKTIYIRSGKVVEPSGIINKLEQASGVSLSGPQDAEFDWHLWQDGSSKIVKVPGVSYSAHGVRMADYDKIEKYLTAAYGMDKYNVADGVQGGLRGYYVNRMACALNFHHDKMGTNQYGLSVPIGDSLDVTLECGYFDKSDSH